MKKNVKTNVNIAAETSCEDCSKPVKFTIASNHESDLNKTMLTIERAAIATATNKVLEQRRSPKKALSVLKHMNYIESTVPTLTTILVAGISLRGNLSKRANEQLAVLTKDYKRCSAELAALSANDKSMIKTPVISKLRRLVKHNDKVETSSTYILTETGSVQPCEVHHFDEIVSDEVAFSNVAFFTYKDKADLCIAAAVNSTYTPKAFETIKISELSNWLTQHNLRTK